MLKNLSRIRVHEEKKYIYRHFRCTEKAPGIVVSADTLIAAADGDPHGGHKTEEKKGSGKTSSTNWSL